MCLVHVKYCVRVTCLDAVCTCTLMRVCDSVIRVRACVFVVVCVRMCYVYVPAILRIYVCVLVILQIYVYVLVILQIYATWCVEVAVLDDLHVYE